MKNFLILYAVIGLFAVSGLSAQTTVNIDTIENRIPYGKMLKMSHDELLNQHFKFNEEKNQYTLKKKNGMRVAATILGAIADNPTNYVPDVNDYQVIIQKGNEGVAYIEVVFYDTDLYHKILTFAKDNGQNQLETNTGLSDKVQFNYDKYSFSLDYSTNKQSSTQTTTRDTSTRWTTAKEHSTSTSHDESYNIYTFTIYTGTEPSSAYITKQQEKAKKNDAKGKKKQSAADLM